MAQRIINESILVVRDGKRITPKIGKVFDLTDSEIADLERVRPQAISKAVATAVDPQSTAIVAEEVKPTATADEDGLANLTKDQLITLAESKGIDVPARATKEKLIDLISAADSGDDL